MKNIQVCMVQSSTTVKKYLWPNIEGVKIGPLIPMCSKSNGAAYLEELREKRIFFYLAI